MPNYSQLQLRLKRACDWMKINKNILKHDIASKMGITDVSFSRGFARCGLKDDEDFVIKFHAATDEIFSLDWLLTGKGTMFPYTNPSTEPIQTDIPSWADSLISLVSNNIKATEELVRENEKLKESIQSIIEENKKLRLDLARLLKQNNHQTVFYDATEESLPMAAEDIN